jgi:prepilin peptidase CpaA
MNESVVGALLVTLLITAVCLDIRGSRIPNWLTFGAMSGGLFTQAVIGGAHGAVFSLLGFATGLALFLVFYFLGDMGAGDVKLMAAVGSIIGPYGAFISGILAVLVGGLYAVGAMCYQSGVDKTVRKITTPATKTFLVTDLAEREQSKSALHLRYGLAIASGTLLFRLGIHPFGG